MMIGNAAHPFNVVVVEDTLDDEMMTLRAFRKTGLSLCVRVARDGEEALAILTGVDQVAAPDLVLLDLKLPKLNGLELLRELRLHPTTATLPIVCFTSSDESADKATCYALGANGYVQKPVDYGAYLLAVSVIAQRWLPEDTSGNALPLAQAA